MYHNEYQHTGAKKNVMETDCTWYLQYCWHRCPSKMETKICTVLHPAIDKKMVQAHSAHRVSLHELP